MSSAHTVICPVQPAYFIGEETIRKASVTSIVTQLVVKSEFKSQTTDPILMMKLMCLALFGVLCPPAY